MTEKEFAHVRVCLRHHKGISVTPRPSEMIKSFSILPKDNRSPDKYIYKNMNPLNTESLIRLDSIACPEQERLE